MVDFFGWSMPLRYRSQIEEHRSVRHSAGVFDISHMLLTDVSGTDSKGYLRKILANDVENLKQHGTALYSCLLNYEAGIIDDLIVYFLADNKYRIISNAGSQEKIKSWLKQIGEFYDVEIEYTENLSIIALQGPRSRNILTNLYSENNGIANLKPFQFIVDNNFFIACTGYTGEDGFEVVLPSELVVEFWNDLIEAGAHPIGLAARDSLRLEAGLNLYSADMDPQSTPLETGLGWTISWEPKNRDFIGRVALEQQSQIGPKVNRKGLILEAKGVLRAGHIVFYDDKEVGIITSGGFSPTIGKAIALARLKSGVSGQLQVKIRDNFYPVTIVEPPFVRKGKILV